MKPKWICENCFKKLNKEYECFTDANWMKVKCFVCNENIGNYHILGSQGVLEEIMKDREFITVNSCARCGKDHEHLEFRKFRNNPIIDPDGITWSYWGMCPIMGEPILLTFEDCKIGDSRKA
jgi:hypothetical protein